METNIARVLPNANAEDKKLRKPPPALCQFDPSVMVDMFPGPALLVDGEMQVKYHNDFARSLLGPLRDREAFLKSMVSRCLSNACPDSQKATLQDHDGLRHYDLYALPLEQQQKKKPPLVFLFGKETTIEHNLTDALVESRQMFKDLVSCSTDFAWETDNSGNFIYTSAKGILGYTSFELNGKNACDMIIGGEGINPFDTLDKINDMELWLKRADGSMACLLVSAVPVLDNRAKWQGARGVCRDITHIREREAILRRTRKQEHVLNKIVSTIRDMVLPSDMLESALSATMEGINADFCCIIQKAPCPDGHFKAEVKQQQGTLSDPELISTLRQTAMEFWQYSGCGTGKIKTLQVGKQHVLLGITNHHTVDNGAIFLVRNNGREWQKDETHLFDGITTHLGIAIEQAITHEELERRAFTDELTNLLNRRAFREEVKKRIKNQKRSRKEGALLYLDLDNFKNVNDSRGHAHGDRILKEFARIIGDNIRVGDCAARLGGDEFSIWLDEIPAKEALVKAGNFVLVGPQLSRLANVKGPQLSMSIGIAISKPECDLTIDELIEHADTALYQAKASGKASCVVYDPDNINFPGSTAMTSTRHKEDANA